MGELFVLHAALGENAALKSTHVEEEVGVVLAVHGDKAALPLRGCDGARETVLDVPEHSTTTAWGREGREGRRYVCL